MPYWLKGGVIGGGVVLILSVLNISCLYFLPPDSWGFECLPFAIPWIPFWFVPQLTSLPGISYEVIVVTAWFILGSIVGVLFSYIKSKKEKCTIKKSPPKRALVNDEELT